MHRLLATLALATLALVAAACGSTNAGEPSAPPATGAPTAGPADPSAPVVVADKLVFLQDEVAVPAGAPFTLTFENRESAPHNITIAADDSYAQVLFQGEIFSEGTREYAVPALAAGSYVFRCDVHPDMQGVITAG